MRVLLISLLAVFALAACSSGGTETASQETAATEAAAETKTVADHDGGHDGDAATEATVASVQTGEIEIAGTVGCGHCTYSIGEGCSAAVQTADGAVYILEGLEAGDEPFEQRFGGETITIRGAAVERDGIGYVTVAGFDL